MTIANSLIGALHPPERNGAPPDRDEVKRQFEQFLAEDLRDLREALKLETTSTLSSKVVAASVLGVAAAAAASLAPVGLPLAGLLGAGSLLKAGAAVGGIGGLINTGAKFSKTRTKILESHPAAYTPRVASSRLSSCHHGASCCRRSLPAPHALGASIHGHAQRDGAAVFDARHPTP
jgi:hypothetical protein